jgi:hypothetical protein
MAKGVDEPARFLVGQPVVGARAWTSQIMIFGKFPPADRARCSEPKMEPQLCTVAVANQRIPRAQAR